MGPVSSPRLAFALLLPSWLVVLAHPASGQANGAGAPNAPVEASGAERARVAPRRFPIVLDWVAPQSCGGPEGFLVAMQRRSRAIVPARSGEPARRLRVVVQQKGQQLRGTLSLLGTDASEGRRVVEAGSCAEVVEALALAAVLSVDPEALWSGASEAGHTPSQGEVPSDEAARRGTPRRAPARRNEGSLETQRRLGRGWSLGLLGAERGYLTAGQLWEYGLWARVRGGRRGAFLDLSLRHSTLDNGAAAFSFWTGRLTASPAGARLFGDWVVSPRLWLEAGSFGAEGRGTLVTHSVDRSLWLTGAEAALGWHPGALSLELAGSLQLPLVARRFVLGDDARRVGRISGLSASGELRLGWAFGAP